jgi:hypothetical protein
MAWAGDFGKSETCLQDGERETGGQQCGRGEELDLTEDDPEDEQRAGDPGGRPAALGQHQFAIRVADGTVSDARTESMVLLRWVPRI